MHIHACDPQTVYCGVASVALPPVCTCMRTMRHVRDREVTLGIICQRLLPQRRLRSTSFKSESILFFSHFRSLVLEIHPPLCQDTALEWRSLTRWHAATMAPGLETAPVLAGCVRSLQTGWEVLFCSSRHHP